MAGGVLQEAMQLTCKREIERVYSAKKKKGEKKRIEDSKKYKEFHSAYGENDRELPYDFDLLYDIKSEMQLLDALTKGTGYHPIKDIEDVALGYGLTKEYLIEKYGSVVEDCE
jgi:hypothetical protein